MKATYVDTTEERKCGDPVWMSGRVYKSLAVWPHVSTHAEETKDSTIEWVGCSWVLAIADTCEGKKGEMKDRDFIRALNSQRQSLPSTGCPLGPELQAAPAPPAVPRQQRQAQDSLPPRWPESKPPSQSYPDRHGMSRGCRLWSSSRCRSRGRGRPSGSR